MYIGKLKCLSTDALVNKCETNSCWDCELNGMAFLFINNWDREGDTRCTKINNISYPNS